jgi:hypothetical protein
MCSIAHHRQRPHPPPGLPGGQRDVEENKFRLAWHRSKNWPTRLDVSSLAEFPSSLGIVSNREWPVSHKCVMSAKVPSSRGIVPKSSQRPNAEGIPAYSKQVSPRYRFIKVVNSSRKEFPRSLNIVDGAVVKVHMSTTRSNRQSLVGWSRSTHFRASSLSPLAHWHCR